MPLGIVTDDEFVEELRKINKINNPNSNDKSNVNNVEYKEINKSGRNIGDVNIPEALRNVIAEERINGATPNEIRNIAPVSDSSIHAYSNGSTSTSHDINSDDKLALFVSNVRTKITKRASRTLIRALDAITDQKIDDLKANEISILAKNMSSIIKDVQPIKEVSSGINASFVIFTPPQKSLDKYDVIDVSN